MIKLINEKYRIIRQIGAGGFGKVYLAENMKIGTKWAIKEIEYSNDELKNIINEIEMLKKNKNSFLPLIVDVIEEANKIYIVMEYIEGQNLNKYIERKDNLDITQIYNIVIQICSFMKLIHKNKQRPLIHGDLKPSNIIMQRDGKIKIVDLGSAQYFGQNTRTEHTCSDGFTAPEVLSKGKLSIRSDIYSLGAIMYYLFTKEIPVTNSDLEYKKCQLFEKAVRKCHMHNPKYRYSTVDKVICDLKTMLPIWANVETSTKTKNNKLYISILGNTEFACELAYSISKFTKQEVILADLNLLEPTADLYLNVKRFPARFNNEETMFYSGLDGAIKALRIERLSDRVLKNLCSKTRSNNNLYVLTGNYSLDEYEYYREKDIEAIVNKLSRAFDIVILSVNNCIYDTCTITSLLLSEKVIIPFQASIPNLRAANSQIEYLVNKQKLVKEKFCLVSYEHIPNVSLDRMYIKKAWCGEYLGNINFNKSRVRYRDMKVPYIANIGKEGLKEYRELCEKLGLLEKKSLMMGG